MNWLKIQCNKFKSWIIVFFIGSAVLAAGSSVYEEQRLDADLKAIPQELRLKTDKEKILDSETIKERVCTSFDNCTISSDIKKYYYISDKIVATGTMIITENKKEKVLEEIVDRRTPNTRVFKKNDKEEIFQVYTGVDQFYNDNGVWKEVETATTTLDAWQKQAGDMFFNNQFAWRKLLFKMAIAADYYSGAGDGDVWKENSTNWDTTHDATTGQGINGWSTDGPRAGSARASGGYSIARLFEPTNTSGLDDDCIVVSVSFNGYVTAKQNNDNDGDDWINIVGQTSQAGTDSLSTADYDQCGSINNPTEGATRIDIGDITTSAYNTWTFNSTGISWINKTGYTMIGLREGHDAIDSAVTNSIGVSDAIHIRASSYTGTSQDPYLSITCQSDIATTNEVYIINFE